MPRGSQLAWQWRLFQLIDLQGPPECRLLPLYGHGGADGCRSIGRFDESVKLGRPSLMLAAALPALDRGTAPARRAAKVVVLTER